MCEGAWKEEGKVKKAKNKPSRAVIALATVYAKKRAKKKPCCAACARGVGACAGKMTFGDSRP